MHPIKLSQAIATVNDIAAYSERGSAELAGEARRTLNDLCCEWSDELGCMSYPETIRAALRARGLRETA
jgi:hypothetical protein